MDILSGFNVTISKRIGFYTGANVLRLKVFDLGRIQTTMVYRNLLSELRGMESKGVYF